MSKLQPKSSSVPNVNPKSKKAEAETTFANGVLSAVESYEKTNVNEDDLVFEFQAGYTDEKGEVHKEYELRELTGEDEDYLANANLRKNNGKYINVLLARVITRIGTITPKTYGIDEWRNIVKRLYAGDQDSALLKVRKYAMGADETTSIKHKCADPECSADLVTEFDVEDIEIVPFSGEVERPFELKKGFTDRKGVSHTTGVMRLATGEDRELFLPVAMKNYSRGKTLLLTRLMTFDDEYPVSEDLVRKLLLGERNKLFDMQDEMQFGPKQTVSAECDVCGNVFDVPLSALNFT